MPIGTIHWLPQRSSKIGRKFILTAARLRLMILLTALFLTGIAALFFHFGGINERAQFTDNRQNELIVLRGELYQLSERVMNLRFQLEEISTREKQVLVAGAGLNLDFSQLIPQTAMIREPPRDNMFRFIDELEMEIMLMERLADAELMAYDSLVCYLMGKDSELAGIPSIWPVDGIFVSDFGPRIDPFTGAVRIHKGIDLACVSGTPIYAPADGVIVFVGWTGGWGLNIVVRHSDRISTRYAHCSVACTVVGQDVTRGDLIARVGSTGRSIAPHLHYEVLINGVQVDPEDYILREGSDSAVF
ncbi:MAG: peptidoglycan DD-metalloendopeptidase family protein [Candidatus Aegiribacteria sp.]|nr:peptidoglycan DD-metalloendopeptidase family protein [Candidatus Aegiribacteria sp.]